MDVCLEQLENGAVCEKTGRALTANLFGGPAQHVGRAAVPFRDVPAKVRDDHRKIHCTLKNRPLPRFTPSERGLTGVQSRRDVAVIVDFIALQRGA